MYDIGQKFKNKYSGQIAELRYIDTVSSSFFSYFTLYLTDPNHQQRTFTLTEAQLNDHWLPVEVDNE